MDTPRRSYWHTAPRSALLNVSNGQPPSIRGSSSFDRHKTPTKESQRVLSASVKRINLSIHRELSKSHGDLSNLRPKSPPIQNMPVGLHGLHLSPGNYVDDTQNFFSPSYNRQARQARQALPNDWMTGAAGSQLSTRTEGSASAGKQIYHSPLSGIHHSHHIEAEPAEVPIQGLTSGYIQPLNFCVPVTRSHPGDEDQRRKALHGDAGRNLAVEHIDISTAWNGLSDVDANELFRVHQAFISTLEKMLANELWQIYQQFQQQDSAGNIRPIHTLFSAGIVRGISFCRDQLVSEMAEILYSSKENMAKAKSGFLPLYLIATDALVRYYEDDSRDTSITVRVRCDPSSPRPHPVVDAAWVPDSLVFEALDEFPVEGQSFSIVPRYYSKSAFRPTHFPKNIKYSIESESRHSPLSWLVWNDEIAGFKGIVPFYSEVNSYVRRLADTCRDFCETNLNSLKIIVQAVLVDDNGSSIRYERILRARLTIKVVPWYANNNCGSSVPCISDDASEYPTTPSSPFLHGKNATFQLGSIARFSVLPPPAIGLTARPTLGSQTSTDGNVLDATSTGWDPTTRPSNTSQLAAPEGGFMAQHTYPSDLWRLPEQASISLNDTGTAHSSPRQHVEALSTPPMVKGELATLSMSGKLARKLHARSSLNKLLPFCRSLETGKQSKQEIGVHSAEPGRNTHPFLDSGDEESSIPIRSSGLFYNSFGPLCNARSSPTLVGEDALTLRASEREASTNYGENIKHRSQDSGCYVNTGNTDSGEQANKTYPVSSSLDDGVTAAEGVSSNSIFPDWKGQARLRQSSSASFSHRHASTSSTSGSRSTSSDIEFIVEQTPCARKVSHGEQARMWNLLSQSDSGKENQPGPEGKEVRLSEDEKKAIEEAMRRSIDDLAEGFDDIFLEDNSESNSSDDL